MSVADAFSMRAILLLLHELVKADEPISTFRMGLLHS